MIKVIAALIVFFLFVAFLGNVSYLIENPLIAYFYFLLEIIIRFFPIFLIIFLAITGYLVWHYYTKRHSKEKTIHNIILIVQVLVISSFSALILLFLIGFIQLNIYSIFLYNNPSAIGIKTDINDIYNSLESNNKLPIIITSDKDPRKNIIALTKASSGIENFYGNVILSSIPNALIFSISQELPNIISLDNTLIISQVSTSDMKKISPLLSTILIKNYFSDRQLKSNAKIIVMDEKEYLEFRNKDVKEKISNIKTQSSTLDESINLKNQDIENSNEELTNNSLLQEEIFSSRDSEYSDCLNVGEYDDDNNFLRENSKADCQSILDRWEEVFIEGENSGKELKEKIDEDQKKLKEYEFLFDFFKAREQLTDISSNNIPSELGVFIPEDEIKIVLINQDSNSVASFFSTLIHEYLHYESYTKGKRFESAFFEEGLTEYFARETIKDSMQVNTNVGYPAVINIIKVMLQRIPETDLADLYFTKDQEGLEETLDLVYGENFYKDNIVLIESLLYTSDPEQKLELANQILEKIEGEKLIIEDIYSN